MQRIDVLTSLANMVTPDDVIVSWRSTIWDDWRDVAPGEGSNTFPLTVLGSVSSTALGLAISLPHRRVVAVESDGSALMNTGIMCTLGNERPPNLTVIVLDNGMYESIGGPPTLTSFNTDLAKMAEGAGCINCFTVKGVEQFQVKGRRLLEDQEFGYLVGKIAQGSPAPRPRSQVRPTDGIEDKYRFLRHIEEIEGSSCIPAPAGPQPERD